MGFKRIISFTVCLAWIMGCTAPQGVAQVGPADLAVNVPAGSSSDDKSKPQLSIRVYGFARLSPRLLQASEIEAARLLSNVPADLNWVDCTSRSASAVCMSDLTSKDLAVRVLAKAPPTASLSALGFAGSITGVAIAFLFYDRIVAERTQGKSLPSMLGRVMAHEIVHVLLPGERHSDFGLMRGQWNTDDLRTDSSACVGLPRDSVQRMQKEALRRVAIARNFAPK